MKKIKLNYWGIIIIILFASFSRLIPHIPNFTPVGAIALLGGSYFKNKFHAFLIPISSLFISDLIINNFFLNNYFKEFTLFYSGFIWQYLSFILIIIIGIYGLKKFNIKKLLISTIVSSLVFFIITNFGVWISGSMYSKDLFGLILCYTLAIPFYKGTLLGFLFYSFLLFGITEFSKSKKSIITK
ncbi:MAG: DUF6580 family putative transport protein [Flavobacteriaceae bacterium]|tara:strand:+ start:213 stop:767 length:555 start_codon:yes stop_codon:yes gene_type:complete